MVEGIPNFPGATSNVAADSHRETQVCPCKQGEGQTWNSLPVTILLCYHFFMSNVTLPTNPNIPLPDLIMQAGHQFPVTVEKELLVSDGIFTNTRHYADATGLIYAEGVTVFEGNRPKISAWCTTPEGHVIVTDPTTPEGAAHIGWVLLPDDVSKVMSNQPPSSSFLITMHLTDPTRFEHIMSRLGHIPGTI